MIHLEILVNDDGTNTLQVTGSPEDIAAITSFLVVSIQEVQEEVKRDTLEGGDDLVG